MKYILSSVKSLLKKDKITAFMMTFGLLVSAFVIVMSYGIFYQVLQGKIDELNLMQGIEITCNSSGEDYVSWNDMKQCIKKLDSRLYDNLGEVRLLAKADREETDYFRYLSFDFLLDKKGDPKYLDMTPSLVAIGGLKAGRYFTEEEFNNAERVAVGFNYMDEETQEDQSDIARSYVKPGDEGYFIVDGEEFKNIGTAFFWTTPQFPVTCLKGDKEVYEIVFEFKNSSITNFQYENLTTVFKNEFGDLVNIPDYKLKKMDASYYFIIAVVVVIMALLSILVLSLIFKYVYITNENKYRIYQICGCSKWRILSYYIGQCLLTAVFAFVLMSLIYFPILLPLMGNMLSYLPEAYSIGKVIILFVLYVLLNVIITLVLGLRLLKKRPLRGN